MTDRYPFTVKALPADGDGMYVVEDNCGEAMLVVFGGGTGPCWNIRQPDDDQYMHVCDLDEFINVLGVLRESDAYRKNVERWES